MAYTLTALAFLLALTSSGYAQADPDRLTLDEEKDFQAMLATALQAKPGSIPLNLADAENKRVFDLSSRVAEYGMLKINRSMVEKKYVHDTDFVGFYMSRYGKLYDEKAKNAWLIAYARENKKEKAFFDKELAKTGLKGDKRDKIIVSHYHLPYPAERIFYMEIVSVVYKNGEADFSVLPKRMKDWVAERNAMFP